MIELRPALGRACDFMTLCLSRLSRLFFRRAAGRSAAARRRSEPDNFAVYNVYLITPLDRRVRRRGERGWTNSTPDRGPSRTVR